MRDYDCSALNFYCENGILYHYRSIEAVKTKDGKIISNLDCWNRGFAHCTKPSKTDAQINLTTFKNFAYTIDDEELRDIVVLEVEGWNTTLFTWDGRYFLNDDDEQRYMVELTKPCNTIKEAKQSMKPEGVKNAESALFGLEVKRQGDLFFIPTPLRDKDMETIDKIITHRELEYDYGTDSDVVVTKRIKPEIFDDSRHTSTRVGKIKTQVYAKGFVRHPQHRALRLGEVWYLVLKNIVKATVTIRSQGGD